MPLLSSEYTLMIKLKVNSVKSSVISNLSNDNVYIASMFLL
jgi:hypothetical protein